MYVENASSPNAGKLPGENKDRSPPRPNRVLSKLSSSCQQGCSRPPLTAASVQGTLWVSSLWVTAETGLMLQSRAEGGEMKQPVGQTHGLE